MSLRVDLGLIPWPIVQLALPKEVQRFLTVLADRWTVPLTPALDLLYFQESDRLSLVFEQFHLLSP
jgi:hypothetical protein